MLSQETVKEAPTVGAYKRLTKDALQRVVNQQKQQFAEKMADDAEDSEDIQEPEKGMRDEANKDFSTYKVTENEECVIIGTDSNNKYKVLLFK